MNQTNFTLIRICTNMSQARKMKTTNEQIGHANSRLVHLHFPALLCSLFGHWVWQYKQLKQAAHMYTQGSTYQLLPSFLIVFAKGKRRARSAPRLPAKKNNSIEAFCTRRAEGRGDLAVIGRKGRSCCCTLGRGQRIGELRPAARSARREVRPPAGAMERVPGSYQKYSQTVRINGS